MKTTNQFINLSLKGFLEIADSYTLPTVDGSFGHIMITDGIGGVTWADPGTLAINTDDVSEASNLYFTPERVDDRISILIQDGTGLTWTYNDPSDTFTGNVSLSPFTTTDLTEGINQYYTGERVDDRVSTLLQNGTGISWVYSDNGASSGTLTPTISLSSFNTDDLSEGAINKYFTNESIDDRVSTLIQDGTGLTWTYNDPANTFTGNVSLATFDTDDLSEGAINKYFTNERVDDRVSDLMTDTSTITWTYNDISNTLEANAAAQPIAIKKTGVLQSTRGTLNFIEGANIAITVSDNGITDAADITISGTGVFSPGTLYDILNGGSIVGDSDIERMDFSSKFSVIETVDKLVEIDIAMLIDELANVAISSPISNGEALIYNSSIGIWENQSILHGLIELTDVLITSPIASGDALIYNSVNGLWENSSLSLSSLVDVSDSLSAGNGDVLRYSGGLWETGKTLTAIYSDGFQTGTEFPEILNFSNKFIISQPIPDFISIDIEMTLDELTNVTLSSPLLDGDILAYNSSSGQWENTTDGVAVDIQAVYGNSTLGRITTDSTRGSFEIKQGSGSNTDIILEGINDVDVTTFSLTGEGKVTNGEWNGTEVGILYGGTGETTAQAAIDALTQVALGATSHVLTKDGSGNATWQATASADLTIIQVDGVQVSTGSPTLDFDSMYFSLTESPTDDFDITFLPGGIDHDSLLNFVTDEHIDHTTITITAGSGLSYSVFGTDISQDSTIDLDLSDMVTETSIGSTDLVPFWDVINSSNKNITYSQFTGSLNHDTLLGFVANEHIDHTLITITAGVGLSYSSGGTDISSSSTIDLDITELSSLTGTIVSADTFAMYNADQSAHEEVTLTQLAAGISTELGLIDGSGSTNEVAYWSDSDTITGDSGFTFDGTTLSVPNLTVNGTTTTVDSTIVTIADPVFQIGDDAVDDNKDRGISFIYNDGVAKEGFFGYDDSTGKFIYIPDATNTSEVFTGTSGDSLWGDVEMSTIKITGGSPTSTKFLKSDAVGIGTWNDIVLTDVTDITATAAELNLLDLSGLSSGHVLAANGLSTAVWRQLRTGDLDNDLGWTSNVGTVTGSGVVNYFSVFTGTGTSIGNNGAVMRESSGAVSIGTTTGGSGNKLYVTQGSNSGNVTGITGTSTGTASQNVGIVGIAENATLKNVGIKGMAGDNVGVTTPPGETGVIGYGVNLTTDNYSLSGISDKATTGTNYGLHISVANGATNNYLGKWDTPTVGSWKLPFSIDASGTVDWRDIDDLTADGSPDGAADYVMTWDATDSTHKKVLIDNLPGGGGSVFTPGTVNGTIMKEVSQESDFGTAVAGVITLAANTAYFVRGNINCTNRLAITNSNIAIIGWDRDVDGLTYTGAAGAGDFITVTDVNFQLSNLKFSSTNSTGGDVVLRAVNYDAAEYNAGRDKVLTIINCQFRNCFDVWFIEGFDLVDIQNTLVWYIKATTIGCQFKNVSKLQLSSCEYVRWFDETNIANSLGAWDAVTSYSLGDIVTEGPTFYRALTNNVNRQPSTTLGVDWEVTGYSTASMIELLDNAGGPGFGAVNINGGIVHPQQTQVGIDIDTASTTGFGTISSNAFINVGLTTGKVFLPEIPVQLLPDYSQTATYKFDVFANQGILNSVSGAVSTLSANATATTVSAVYADVDTGASAATQAAVRFTSANTGIVTYDGTKQIYCSIHASLSLDSGGNDDTYTVGIFKDSGAGYVLLPGSEVEIQFSSNNQITLDVGTVAINYGTLFNNGDAVKMQIKSTGASAAITVTDYQLVIRE